MAELCKADFQEALDGFKRMRVRLHADAVARLAEGNSKRYDDYINKDSPMIEVAENMCIGIMQFVFANE